MMERAKLHIVHVKKNKWKNVYTIFNHWGIDVHCRDGTVYFLFYVELIWILDWVLRIFWWLSTFIESTLGAQFP